MDSGPYLHHQMSSRASKKRKYSGCLTVLLIQHLDSVRRLLHTIENGDADGEQDLSDEVHDLVKQLVNKMESQLKDTKSIAFSSFTFETLTGLNLTEGSGLALKPWMDRVEEVSAVGSNQFMTSTVFYSILSLLSSLIPSTCEASARAWVDIFLYRASAMLTPPRRMVLRMEHSITMPTSHAVLAGHIDYTAAIGLLLNRDDLNHFPHHPRLGFFVAEVKGPSVVLNAYIAQAVGELFATAKTLKKSRLRGTITNGFTWIFIIVYLNDTDGGTYSVSQPLAFSVSQANELYHIPETDKMPNLISAILTYWLEHSFDDIREDDWFRKAR
ncbi:hypothetical protein HGRIS_000293 [Hohenbuehelia grisea]|uniref:Uncharacterized protein n=1 Tax=Hohenbuehelia grisea TaxID=104357 RepID=A0ABR3JRU4_9AGAR